MKKLGYVLYQPYKWLIYVPLMVSSTIICSILAAIESIEASRKQLVNGTSVIIFPEGTRSRDGKIRKFKKGAFKIAHLLELPILPVTIVETNKIMGSGFINVLPGSAQLIIHKPIDVKKYKDSQDELSRITREIIASGLPVDE